jgi:hypothetical protein
VKQNDSENLKTGEEPSNADVIQADKEMAQALTEMIVLKNKVIELTHQHIDKCREFAEKKARLDYLLLLRPKKVTRQDADNGSGDEGDDGVLSSEV